MTDRVPCPACWGRCHRCDEHGQHPTLEGGRRVMVPCQDCGGAKDYAFGTEVCRECQGDGEDPKGSHDCPNCGGRGNVPCSLCQGAKTVPRDVGARALLNG